MKRLLITLTISGVLILASACTPENLGGLVDELGAPAGDRSGGIEVLAEGRGPLEYTPGSGDEGITSNDQAGEIVSSSGERIVTGGSVSDEPGTIGASAPGGSVEKQPANWLTYTDEAFKFSIDYPDTYSILPEIELLRDIDPAMVHRVRFLDTDLAKGDTVEFEIPNFTVEVFELSSQTLEAFLDIQAFGAEIEVYTQGDLTGFRVYYNRLSVPNEYYYFAGDGYAYKLTPLGVYSEDMLHSFQLLH
jgi:hypothetical protein